MTDIFSAIPLPEFSNHQKHQLLQNLRQQPWFVWLDSAGANHPDAQYELITWQPEHLLLEQDGCFYLDDQHVDDPFEAMQALLDRYQLQNQPDDLPFAGGWLGYLAYDMARHLERLPTLAASDIHQPDLALGFYKAALLHDLKTDSWHIVGEQQSAAALKQQLETLCTSRAERTESFRLLSQWQSNLSKEAYQQRFERIQHYLIEGDCYQINLAQRFSADYAGCPFTAYLNLRKANGAPFSAYLNTATGHILSVSPERFIRLNGRQIESKPIKGTRPRVSDPLQDESVKDELKHAPKDNAENLMIVDLLRNDIGKVAVPGSVKVPGLFEVESFPAVHHLVSTITAELDSNASAVSLLKGAFPGGSITGAPKVRAMEIIEELEPHRRSAYCGSVVCLSLNGNMDSSISIRTLVCDSGRVHCWAGGGIVADSDVESEYQETLDKVSKILPLLASDA